MRFSVLGPLSVSLDGEAVPLGGRKQRTLLAVLLLHANEVVPRDQLIDALWGERPPASATESLVAYLYRLRKLLGRDRLPRETGGYLLRVEADELDADRFERLLADARRDADDGDHRGTVNTLTEALGLWRGSAWADMLDDPSLGAAARRLEELRLSALEYRVEAELALDGGTETVAELEQLVAEHPLRERLLAALMLALYRAGRQTDALEVFQTARRRLLDERGLELGPELHELQRRILQHDRTLGAPRRFPAMSGPGSRRRLASVGLLGLAAVVIVVFLLGAGAASRQPGIRAGASGIISVDASSDRVVSATPLSGAPGAVTAGYGSVWVADPAGQDVSRVDPATGDLVEKIPVDGEPGSIVSGGGAIWVASTVDATVRRINPTVDAVTQTVRLPGANPGAIAYGAGRLWVADAADHALFEIDPTTGIRQRTLSLDLQPSALVVADGTIWIAGYNSATVERLDPASGHVLARIDVGDGPAALAFEDGAVWVANSIDATVSRIDPDTGAVTATIPVVSGPTALTTAGGSVWVADQYGGAIARIDPADDRVANTIAITGAPTSLTVTDNRVWAGVTADAGSHRGGTLTIVTPGALTSSSVTNATIDPAFYNLADNPQFAGLAYDALVGFDQSPGAAGLRLVPDLALSIPTPTDGGRVYAFRIRPGIRYSNGQLLRAGDFRRGIERLFRVRSPAAFLYRDLVGAAACGRRPGACELARGVVTNDRTGAITFHFTAPDPEFLFQLTDYAFSSPIPPGTPDHETGSRSVPGTGPYEIASITNTEIRFVRNPYFHEWSHAAQPAGNPDTIVWRSAPSIAAAVAAVEAGRADWLDGPPPLAQFRRLELQNPTELHINPQFAVSFLPINTHVAPFDHRRVRQALNDAINRATLVRLYGGPRFAVPTCQAITPGIRRYCPYTLHPRADGRWTAPDMARARRLVRQSGTVGERIDLVASRDTGFVPPTSTTYIGRVLRALGYRVHITIIPFAKITAAMWDRFQIYGDGNWIPQYPDPSSYLPLFFGCGGANSNGYYCNPTIDREMQRAELLEPTDPAKSRALWEAVDRRLTDAAEWVPTVASREVELTSDRLRNYEYNPVWGFLADQAWVR
jgi:peptide/nickel transport system substrate-binding protein